MNVVIISIIISMATSLIVAAIVTFLGCYSFKIYIEREVNRILDEEGIQIEEHVIEVIGMAKKSIRDAYLNK